MERFIEDATQDEGLREQHTAYFTHEDGRVRRYPEPKESAQPEEKTHSKKELIQPLPSVAASTDYRAVLGISSPFSYKTKNSATKAVRFPEDYAAEPKSLLNVFQDAYFGTLPQQTMKWEPAPASLQRVDHENRPTARPRPHGKSFSSGERFDEPKDTPAEISASLRKFHASLDLSNVQTVDKASSIALKKATVPYVRYRDSQSKDAGHTRSSSRSSTRQSKEAENDRDETIASLRNSAYKHFHDDLEAGKVHIPSTQDLLRKINMILKTSPHLETQDQDGNRRPLSEQQLIILRTYVQFYTSAPYDKQLWMIEHSTILQLINPQVQQSSWGELEFEPAELLAEESRREAFKQLTTPRPRVLRAKPEKADKASAKEDQEHQKALQRRIFKRPTIGVPEPPAKQNEKISVRFRMVTDSRVKSYICVSVEFNYIDDQQEEQPRHLVRFMLTHRNCRADLPRKEWSKYEDGHRLIDVSDPRNADWLRHIFPSLDRKYKWDKQTGERKVDKDYFKDLYDSLHMGYPLYVLAATVNRKHVSTGLFIDDKNLPPGLLALRTALTYDSTMFFLIKAVDLPYQITQVFQEFRSLNEHNPLTEWFKDPNQQIMTAKHVKSRVEIPFFSWPRMNVFETWDDLKELFGFGTLFEHLWQLNDRIPYVGEAKFVPVPSSYVKEAELNMAFFANVTLDKDTVMNRPRLQAGDRLTMHFGNTLKVRGVPWEVRVSEAAPMSQTNAVTLIAHRPVDEHNEIMDHRPLDNITTKHLAECNGPQGRALLSRSQGYDVKLFIKAHDKEMKKVMKQLPRFFPDKNDPDFVKDTLSISRLFHLGKNIKALPGYGCWDLLEADDLPRIHQYVTGRLRDYQRPVYKQWTTRLPAGTGMLFGCGGSGKTFVGQLMMVPILTGAWIERNISQYLAQERDNYILQRWTPESEKETKDDSDDDNENDDDEGDDTQKKAKSPPVQVNVVDISKDGFIRSEDRPTDACSVCNLQREERPDREYHHCAVCDRTYCSRQCRREDFQQDTEHWKTCNATRMRVEETGLYTRKDKKLNLVPGIPINPREIETKAQGSKDDVFEQGRILQVAASNESADDLHVKMIKAARELLTHMGRRIPLCVRVHAGSIEAKATKSFTDPFSGITDDLRYCPEDEPDPTIVGELNDALFWSYQGQMQGQYRYLNDRRFVLEEHSLAYYIMQLAGIFEYTDEVKSAFKQDTAGGRQLLSFIRRELRGLRVARQEIAEEGQMSKVIQSRIKRGAKIGTEWVLWAASVVTTTASVAMEPQIAALFKPHGIIIEEAARLTESMTWQFYATYRLAAVRLFIGSGKQLGPTVVCPRNRNNFMDQISMSLMVRMMVCGFPAGELKKSHRFGNQDALRVAQEASHDPGLEMTPGSERPNETARAEQLNLGLYGVARPVVWVNVKEGNQKTDINNSTFNADTAKATMHDVVYRIERNVPGQNIAIICLYNAQKFILRRLLEQAQLQAQQKGHDGLATALSQVQLTTCDGFQGKEADYIIVDTCSVLGFIRIEQRTNVLLTRHKICLTIIGDAKDVTARLPRKHALNKVALWLNDDGVHLKNAPPVQGVCRIFNMDRNALQKLESYPTVFAELGLLQAVEVEKPASIGRTHFLHGVYRFGDEDNNSTADAIALDEAE